MMAGAIAGMASAQSYWYIVHQADFVTSQAG
jgi:hypothetical protein